VVLERFLLKIGRFVLPETSKLTMAIYSISTEGQHERHTFTQTRSVGVI